jgi:topoisomerase-4 subunit A
MSATDIIKHHAKQLVNILLRELEFEKKELQDKLHLRTLERIFIEERIYKSIENKKTAETVTKAVLDGFVPFAKEVGPRGVSDEDVEHLLRIPIRRISLYDINKVTSEMAEIQARIKVINNHLKNSTAYALAYLDGISAKIRANEELGRGKRKSGVGPFGKVDVKQMVKKEVCLRYDSATGYAGTAVAGDVAAELSSLDRIIVVRHNGVYSVFDIPEKMFVGENAWYIGAADKESLAEMVFTIIYKEAETGYPCIKRCVIEGWIMNKEYSLVPAGAAVLFVTTQPKATVIVRYTPKPRLKTLTKKIKIADYAVKGLKAGGIRIAAKEAEGAENA